MCLLKRSEMICYGQLIEDLQNASYVGRYEYLNSQPRTFDLFIRIYGKVKGISGQGGWGSVSRGGREGPGMSWVRFSQEGQQNK